MYSKPCMRGLYDCACSAVKTAWNGAPSLSTLLWIWLFDAFDRITSLYFFARRERPSGTSGCGPQVGTAV